MRTAAGFSLFFVLVTLTSPTPGQDTIKNPPRGNLILSRELSEPALGEKLLEIVRTRFPVVVRTGRFESEDGLTTICVYTRRTSSRVTALDPLGRPHFCPAIASYVDGVRMSDSGTYLNSVVLRDVESIEIMTAADAMLRYGLGANGGEVLVVWTKGRGPHAKPKL